MAGKSYSKENESSKVDLPKGFFDNPVEDAKARHEEYVDPKEKEWENFQRIIAVESYNAENKLGEDLEDIQAERTVEEVEQQLSSWTKVDDLQKRAEKVLSAQRGSQQNKQSAEDVDEDSEDDEDGLDNFINWRCKRTVSGPKKN